MYLFNSFIRDLFCPCAAFRLRRCNYLPLHKKQLTWRKLITCVNVGWCAANRQTQLGELCGGLFQSVTREIIIRVLYSIGHDVP